MAENNVTTLAAKVKKDLGPDDARWFNPDGYESVALCLLDSIYSTGNRYTSVVNALKNYSRARAGHEELSKLCDTAADLVAATDGWGGVDGLVRHTNKCRVRARKDAPRKAEAAYRAAQILAEHGLNTRAEVQAALSDPEAQEASPVKREWAKLPGQSSLITWTYFLMLCGVPGVKADRMIVGYVSEAVGRKVTPKEAASLVSAVADQMGVSRTKLDHAIWRKQSKRPVYLDPWLPGRKCLPEN